MSTLLDDIYKRLGGDTGHYRGISYDLTEKNSYALYSTPNLWGHDAAKIDYVPAAKNLTDGIKEVIASAKYTVDICTMLGSPASADQPPFPDGPFLEAIRDGIKAAAKQSNELVVRIMFGIQPLIVIVGSRMDEWISKLDLPANVPVYVGALASKQPISFNHAKLVIADGQRCIGGGHNMWNLAYCDVAPVHDVSVMVNGPANLVAQRFLNLQWRKLAQTSLRESSPQSRLCIDGKVYNNALPQIQRTPAPKGFGQSRILSVGRLGRGLLDTPEDATASRVARIEAAQLATKSIKLSQQMLGGGMAGSGPYDDQYIQALAKAVVRGVDVYVIISDPGTRTGYSGDGIEKTAKKFFDTIGLVSGLRGKELAAKCAAHVHIAALRFTNRKPGDGDDYWKWMLKDGKRQSPANHAKVYIVDDEVFYVGSDNAYSPDHPIAANPDGFQEFGYIISGVAETKDFLDSYWNKLWGYSGEFKFKNWIGFVGAVGIVELPGAES